MGKSIMGFLRIYLIKNILFLSLLLGGGLWLLTPLMDFFQTNVIINGTISSVLFIGVSYTFYQFYRLAREAQWFSFFEQGKEQFPGVPKPKILAPLRRMSLNREVYSTILGRQSFLNSIEGRLEDLCGINRYLIGLLIFLGLLGTFWGLSKTIGTIAGVVANIDVGSNDIKEAFQDLKQGLQSPLQGMGTAFSSSMFGLGASLILGFLDLQVGKASESFYQEIEEKTLINVSSSPVSGKQHGVAYSQGVLEQAAENLGRVIQALHSHHENRLSIIKTVQQLTNKLEGLTEVLTQNKKQMTQLSDNNQSIQETLKLLTTHINPSHLIQNSEKTVKYLEKIGGSMTQLLEESIQGRHLITQEICSEIRMVAKTISALASHSDE